MQDKAGTNNPCCLRTGRFSFTVWAPSVIKVTFLIERGLKPPTAVFEHSECIFNNNSCAGMEIIVISLIRRHCKIIKRPRKFRIPEKMYRQACFAFIGGMFNYCLPWLGGEFAIKQTMHPLENAYRNYMRTVTGCLTSTPIALLHAIPKFPLLEG